MTPKKEPKSNLEKIEVPALVIPRISIGEMTLLNVNQVGRKE